ncbi:MAG: hypothetical protein AAFN70_06935 [Planctomycetota bacterium]
MQRCPHCNVAIQLDDRDLSAGIGTCPGCGKIWEDSQLIDDRSTPGNLAINDPPPVGCSLRTDSGRTTIYVAKFAIANMLACLGVAIFWNGIVSVFLWHFICALLANLCNGLPAGIPCMDIDDGWPQMNDEPMKWGSTIFLGVFLIPFVCIGLAIVWAFLQSTIGRLWVRIESTHVSYRDGLPFLSRRKRFDTSTTRSVTMRTGNWDASTVQEGSATLIKTSDGQEHLIGRDLPPTKAEWLYLQLNAALRSYWIDES